MIESINNLVKTLNQAKSELDYMKAFDSMSIPLRDFQKYYTWNQTHYTRNCISKTKEYELDLICFSINQTLPIVSIPSTKVFIVNIEGSLLTEKFKKDLTNGLVAIKTAETGENNSIIALKPEDLFTQKNSSNLTAASLHLYLNPLHYLTEHLKDGSTHRKLVHYDSNYS